MKKHRAPLPKIDLDNPEFQDAWRLVQFTRRSVFLTGKAGTGKSTFLRYICRNTVKKFVVLAPTGIAAVNAGGVTLHSFFKLPLKPLLPGDPDLAPSRLRKIMKYSSSHRRLIKELELVVIDEISMVRADIIDFVDRLLRVYSDNPREPFGGKQLLMVGDVFQLEPVVTADMRQLLSMHYTSPFFFAAKVFVEISMVAVELKKVYRQTDTRFISLLDRIRMGRIFASDVELLNSRVVPMQSVDDTSDMTMTLATRRDRVDSINARRLEQLDGNSVTYHGVITGDFPDSSLPTSVDLELKCGAQVVFIKNDPERRWVNGTLGRVADVDSDYLLVELENGETHVVEPVVWSNIKYEFDTEKGVVVERELGSFAQLPLKLAWALTIHKSQGLTFSRVDIDLSGGAFSAGQTYVALSRSRSLEGLRLLSPFRLSDVLVSRVVIDFSRSFNDRGLIDHAIQRGNTDTFNAS